MSMQDLIWWNITSQRKDFVSKDILIVSIPKCGRTWLRVFLNAYYNYLFDGNHTVNRTDSYPDSRPPYLFTHDRFAHLNSDRWYDYVRGKHLIPPGPRRRARVMLLARDLRDVMVSLYFQHTKRRLKFRGDIDALLRDRQRAVDTVVAIMNRWIREFPPERRLITRYEDWKIDPEAGFDQILRFMSGRTPDAAALEYALDYSSFEKMKAREASNKDGIPALRARDVNDEESFKSRRGVVGGYRKYLRDDQIEYIRERMAGLDPAYGYRV